MEIITAPSLGSYWCQNILHSTSVLSVCPYICIEKGSMPLIKPITMKVIFTVVIGIFSKSKVHYPSQNLYKIQTSHPDQCGSVCWALSCKAKGCHFYSWSGHMPGLWVRSQEATDGCLLHQYFSPSLSPSLPLSLKINKILKNKTKQKQPVL